MTPAAETVAIALSVLLHAPPAVAFATVTVDPAQIAELPVIALTVGNEVTVSVAVAYVVPHELVTA